MNESRTTPKERFYLYENNITENDDPHLFEGSRLSLTIIQDQPHPEPERGQWSNQIEFILSTIGFAVGLGNVWRFPYMAYTNGGGSFLIPYTVMLLFAGLPFFFMELSLGQYCGLGPTKIFGRLAPALKGLGFAMVFMSCLLSLYYNMIIAWTLFYMFTGMQGELPWAYCDPASKYCKAGNINDTEIKDFFVGPAEDYFNHALLGLDKKVHNWGNLGGLRWQLVLCLLGAWTLVCLCLIKGVQSAGKVVYFTGKYSFVVLFVTHITSMLILSVLLSTKFFYLLQLFFLSSF